MKIVGLTGGIACGKSTLAEMFRELGASIVDADEISRRLTRPGGEALPALKETFGEFAFYPDGTLNRAVLGDLVFRNPEERKKLDAVLHPMIQEEIEKQIETCRKMGALVVILDVPLLFETGLQELADTTVCASAPLEVQLERLYTRSGLNEEQAMHRIHSQAPVSEKEKLADVVVYTACPLEELRRKTRELYQQWLAEAC